MNAPASTPRPPRARAKPNARAFGDHPPDALAAKRPPKRRPLVGDDSAPAEEPRTLLDVWLFLNQMSTLKTKNQRGELESFLDPSDMRALKNAVFIRLDENDQFDAINMMPSSIETMKALEARFDARERMEAPESKGAR